MRDFGPAGADEGAFGGGQVDRVREDRAGREEVVPVVDGGVGGCVWEKLPHEGDLVSVLGDVRLDAEGLAIPITPLHRGRGRGQLPQRRQRPARTRRREPRRHDRRDEPPLGIDAPDVRDRRLGRGDRLLGRRVAVVSGAEARVVHADAADQGALAAAEAERGEEVGGGDVDGGVVGGAGGAVGEGAGDDSGVGGAGGGVVVVVAERALQGKGVRLEPVEEGGGAEEAGVGVLRGVDVGVLGWSASISIL